MQSSSAPTTISKDDLDRLMSLLKGVTTGAVRVQDGPVDGATSRISERRSRQIRGIHDADLPNTIIETLARRAVEPKRQRKKRDMGSRVRYFLKPVAQTKDAMHRFESLTPMATAIIVYLSTHTQGATRSELVAQLDSTEHTIKNLLSLLSKHHDLIRKENIPAKKR